MLVKGNYPLSKQSSNTTKQNKTQNECCHINLSIKIKPNNCMLTNAHLIVVVVAEVAPVVWSINRIEINRKKETEKRKRRYMMVRRKVLMRMWHV